MQFIRLFDIIAAAADGRIIEMIEITDGGR